MSSCIWWWSLIALIVIITPFVSTTFGWFWYDLYPFLYLALVLSLQLEGGASCMCVSLVLRVFFSTLHTYRGSLSRPLQRLLLYCANLWDCHLTPKRGRLKGLYLPMMFLVLMIIPTVFLIVRLSFRGNVVDVSFYCGGCSLGIS